MRTRLLALMICFVGWASSPIAGLMVSVHLLEHESGAPSQSLDPRFAASHGHHHDFDVPDHSHEIVPAARDPESRLARKMARCRPPVDRGFRLPLFLSDPRRSASPSVPSTLRDAPLIELI